MAESASNFRSVPHELVIRTTGEFYLVIDADARDREVDPAPRYQLRGADAYLKVGQRRLLIPSLPELVLQQLRQDPVLKLAEHDGSHLIRDSRLLPHVVS